MDKSKPILVTGATGYIAGWIIERLLKQGYTVHATVRDPSKKNKIQHLYDLAEQSAGHIQFFKADLLETGSFDEAMKDCEIVIHTASPFVVTNYKDAVKDIIEPAVKGTENVLNSVNRTESVKRVVLTSSIASTYGDAVEIQNTANNEFDENHWNTTSSETHQPYPYSKVMAERKAWEMVEQQDRWDLVCINPALVMGPSLTDASQSGSIEVLQQFGNGTTLFGVPPMWNGIVDVRDVADAHVAAALNPEAHGRYIICGGTLSLLDMGKALTQKFGYKFPFPHFTVPKTAFAFVAPVLSHSREFVKLNMGYPIYFNAQRSVKELGIEYRDVRESVCEHFQQLLDDGIVKKYI
ncbi:aldehyde reductase [Acinetobacter sp. IK40]|jgi:nucleoside-diphosphate-sugar epimerase|uniref:SDR family oxidoreductase n=1 Tax=Acinetobacter sp. IK40 TaxID=2928897 RepID=UPI002D1F88F9|nr:aldehyde reductase [Acinetobacter sp. IK40]MEB3792869.1 aldehyde reductase [Acinetobacter sp. IK40]